IPIVNMVRRVNIGERSRVRRTHRSCWLSGPIMLHTLGTGGSSQFLRRLRRRSGGIYAVAQDATLHWLVATDITQHSVDHWCSGGEWPKRHQAADQMLSRPGFSDRTTARLPALFREHFREMATNR